MWGTVQRKLYADQYLLKMFNISKIRCSLISDGGVGNTGTELRILLLLIS